MAVDGNSLGIVGVLVAGIGALWLQYRIVNDTVIKTLKEDRDRWAEACARKDKILEQNALSARMSVEVAERLMSHDGNIKGSG